jgi:hypothetical protein
MKENDMTVALQTALEKIPSLHPYNITDNVKQFTGEGFQ